MRIKLQLRNYTNTCKLKGSGHGNMEKRSRLENCIHKKHIYGCIYKINE